MSKHHLPASTFEDDDQSQPPGEATTFLDDTPSDDFADPDYDDAGQPDDDNDFADPDADGGGSQEWVARKQK